MKILSLILAIFSLSTQAAVLKGAGASFPAPLYSKWCEEFGKANAGIQVDYQSLGSGAGVSNFLKGTVQFGASDAPLNKEQEAEASAKGIKPLHIPTVMGAVVVTYNLPGFNEALNIDGPTLVDIYKGKITQWNDPRLVKMNPGLKGKAQKIVTVYRADGSGTTAIFTDYLSKVSPEWANTTGHGSSVKWPVGEGARGNEGVSQKVSTTSGALAYVELIYAINKNLPYAQVKNASGKYVTASMESVTSAATGMLSALEKDIRTSITNAKGAKAYPISGITYLIVSQKQEKVAGEQLKKFLNWALAEGQKMAPGMHYAPLPAALTKNAEKTINSIQLN